MIEKGNKIVPVPVASPASGSNWVLERFVLQMKYKMGISSLKPNRLTVSDSKTYTSWSVSIPTQDNTAIWQIRQRPEVYDLCHTFLHVVPRKKHTAMREQHAKRVWFSHGSVFFDSCNVQKRATKSDTLAHCLWQIYLFCGLNVENISIHWQQDWQIWSLKILRELWI